MGNRDKRGREKRKPKKTKIKQTGTPAKRLVEYKPQPPPQQEQTTTDPAKIS